MNTSKLKTSLIACAVGLMSLGTGGAALAQRGDRHDRGDRNDRDWRDDRRGERWQDRREGRRDDYRQGRRGAGPGHSFYIGQRLPPVYHQRIYVVDNWRGHYLHQPPRGYHWVQSGSDYLLVAIATGLIAQAILSN